MVYNKAAKPYTSDLIPSKLFCTEHFLLCAGTRAGNSFTAITVQCQVQKLRERISHLLHPDMVAVNRIEEFNFLLDYVTTVLMLCMAPSVSRGSAKVMRCLFYLSNLAIGICMAQLVSNFLSPLGLLYAITSPSVRLGCIGHCKLGRATADA